MGFKLVRTDADEPCKILLPVGTHLFGRGVFLDCDDRRVSRNHGQLKVTNDAVILTALHHNPCFYKKKNADGTIILHHPCSTELSNGDQFGLVQNAYWYEVICYVTADKQNNDGCDPTPKNVTDKIGINKKAVPESNAGSIENNEVGERMPDRDMESRPNNDQFDGNDSELLEFNMSESVNAEPAQTASPSLIKANNESSTEEQISPENQLTQKYQVDQPSFSPAKRPRLDASCDLKVKTEPVDQEAGYSSDQAGPSSPLRQPKAEPAASPQVPVAAPANRERCWYGLLCYRKNPVHKKEFSHPADSDWGPGERAPCPRGTACRMPDPRHWRDHDHPPHVHPPPEANNESSTEEQISPENQLTQKYQVDQPSFSPAKRPRLDASCDLKVKTEPVDQEAGYSSDQAGPSSPLRQPKAEPAASPQVPVAAPANRERCWYGLLCYRKNPVHKKEFSHPADSDWGPGERAPCPRGTACRMPDPRHWRDHDHPPHVHPPPAPGVSMVQRHGHMFYINARLVNFYEDYYHVEDDDDDDDSVDYDF